MDAITFLQFEIVFQVVHHDEGPQVAADAGQVLDILALVPDCVMSI